MTQPALRTPDLALTHDDRVLLRAIAIAGDAVREPDLAYLLERWHWETPMDGDRVAELAAAGLLEAADNGWFVPMAVEIEVTAALPKALDPMLRGFVGEMLCRNADSIDRLQLGVRRMIAGGRETALVSACQAYGNGQAGRQGPRGEQFVAALGSFKLGPELRVRLRAAVPELEPAWVRWMKPVRDLGQRLTVRPQMQRAFAAAAAGLIVALEVLGRSPDVVERISQR